MIGDTPIIEFLEPEPGSRVARISANIASADGINLLRIVENEWIVESGVWDYEWIGKQMTIRDGSGEIALQITLSPPEFISIDRLRSRQLGYNVFMNPKMMIINGNIFQDCVASDCAVGMKLG